MKKAILVNDYPSVEELNKLFEQGYTVESVDDRGVYILTCDELKAEPINNELLRDDLDIYRSLSKPVTKQPHARIEFDDIRDVPKVWIDGELIDDSVDDKLLVSLKVDWNTDTVTENHKGFDINYCDLTGERPMRRGFREGTPK